MSITQPPLVLAESPFSSDAGRQTAAHIPRPCTQRSHPAARSPLEASRELPDLRRAPPVTASPASPHRRTGSPHEDCSVPAYAGLIDCCAGIDVRTLVEEQIATTTASLEIHEGTGRWLPATDVEPGTWIPQAETGLPNRASRTSSSTEITNLRTGGTRSASAADGKSCSVSDTSASVARWSELLSSSHHRSTAR